jgi:hypothetical protein
VVQDDSNNELLAATPPGWYVGKPMYHDERNECQTYAFDPSERLKVGRRDRQWTATGSTEERCLRTVAYCLPEIAAGRVPE